MPYFNEATDVTINEQLFKSLVLLNDKPFEDDKDNEGLEEVPDGAITFFEANDLELRYRLQINDVRLLEYHR